VLARYQKEKGGKILRQKRVQLYAVRNGSKDHVDRSLSRERNSCGPQQKVVFPEERKHKSLRVLIQRFIREKSGRIIQNKGGGGRLVV